MEASASVAAGRAAPDPLPIIAVVAAGSLVLLLGLAAGGTAVAAGAICFLTSTIVALGQTRRELITWPNAFLVFVAALWFVPIKLYRLPVDLPFQLELYRILIVFLVAAFVVQMLVSGRQVDALGAGRPLFVIAAAVLASQVINASEIDTAQEGQALKSLSMLLSLIVVFLLVASTIKTFEEIRLIVVGLVVGGTIVALFALYESRTGYNFFNHLAQWIPLFDRNERELLTTRAGRLRVHASAQHPIALGTALTMLVPLAAFLILTARALKTKALWVACAFLLIAGAAATISRTTVVMGIAMAFVAYIVRKDVVVRALPLLLVLPIFVNAAAPGAIGGLISSFKAPQGTNFVTSFQDRGGESGSGRLADFGPGIDLWKQSPIVGLGLDNPRIAASGASVGAVGPGTTSSVPIIFDNYYLRALVTLGLVGLIGIVWFIWSTVVRLVKAARGDETILGDFTAACAVACVGYGVSMFLFDAMSFIQVTLLLFITAALGLRAARLSQEESGSPAAADSAARPALSS